MKVVRIYLLVSTAEQDLTRQDDIVHSTRAAGSAGQAMVRTANLAGCGISQIKRIWALHRAKS